MQTDGLFELVQTLDKETMYDCQMVKALAEEYLAATGGDHPQLLQAALIHDIGKMYVSSEILSKKEPLTASELQMVRLHPYMGWLAAKEHGIADEVAEIILYHHGSSPYHLQPIPDAAPECMRLSQILYTFDVYHALTVQRCYRAAMDPETALRVMLSEAQKQIRFDREAMRFLIMRRSKEQ